MRTSSQLLFVLSPSMYFFLFNSLVFVLLLCFILVPHRLWEGTEWIVSLFKNFIVFNKNRREFWENCFGVFPLRGVLLMAGCETLTVKLRSSVWREAAWGHNQLVCDVKRREIREGGRPFHLFIRWSLVIFFLLSSFPKILKPPSFVSHHPFF